MRVAHDVAGECIRMRGEGIDMFLFASHGRLHSFSTGLRTLLCLKLFGAFPISFVRRVKTYSEKLAAGRPGDRFDAESVLVGDVLCLNKRHQSVGSLWL